MYLPNIPYHPPKTNIRYYNNNNNNNTPGLVGLLRYWIAVLGSSSRWEPPPVEIDDAANCLIRLSLLGLDYTAASSKYVFGIKQALRKIFPPLLDLFSLRMGDKYQPCIDRTIESLMDIISGLGPGMVGTDDNEDTEAFLCHSVICSSIPRHHGGTNQLHRLSCQFRVQLAVAAIGSITNGEVKNHLSHCSQQQQPESTDIGEYTISAFDTAVAGLKFLDSLGDGIVDCAPLVPAVAECANAAFLSGSNLLQLDGDGGRQQQALTPSQVALVQRTVGTLEDSSFRISKRTKGMSTNPHMRRLDHYVSVLNQYYRKYGPRQDAPGRGDPGKKQSDVRGFFQTSKNVEDNGNQGKDTDSDTDDDDDSM
mmetsp:Transcript_1956/g.5398  ORF Transcript_1956/g.5398 Transcript_1956/m.5398 type:complete len:366 (-) Transcript_1956:166-1263(-)